MAISRELREDREHKSEKSPEKECQGKGPAEEDQEDYVYERETGIRSHGR
jgi:hypothetical protein